MGKEFGGRERLYVGTKIEIGSVLRVGLDAFYTVSALENVPEELQEAQMIQITSYSLFARNLLPFNFCNIFISDAYPLPGKYILLLKQPLYMDHSV